MNATMLLDEIASLPDHARSDVMVLPPMVIAHPSISPLLPR